MDAIARRPRPAAAHAYTVGVRGGGGGRRVSSLRIARTDATERAGEAAPLRAEVAPCWQSHAECRGTMPHSGLMLVLVSLLSTECDGEYLGVSRDVVGLVLQPTPALASLRSTYQFWHYHPLNAGSRERLEAIEAAGDSVSIRLVAQLQPSSASSSLLLSLLGGRLVVDVQYAVPAGTRAGSCGSTTVHSETTTLPVVDNSSHTAGGCMCSTTFCRCDGPLDRFLQTQYP